MSVFFLNPGAGPVDEASELAARDAIEALIDDIALEPRPTWARRSKDDYGEGRFAFAIFWEGREGAVVEIQMPGVPIDRVRYLAGMNPWQFPRLYVDGSSWLWKFAIEAARGALTGEE